MKCQICSLFANAAITCRFFTSVSCATIHSFILRISNAHTELALVGVCECHVWNGKLVYFPLCDALADSFESLMKNNRNLWSTLRLEIVPSYDQCQISSIAFRKYERQSNFLLSNDWSQKIILNYVCEHFFNSLSFVAISSMHISIPYK